MPITISKYGKTKQYDEPLYVKPVSTQELFPVRAIDETGIFDLGNGKYSKCFILTDINFAGVTDQEQKQLIINFSRVLNSMPCRFMYTIANEYVDEDSFNRRILYKMHGDDLNELRENFNIIIKDKLSDAKQGLYQTIYLTLTIQSDDWREARSNFASIEATLRSAFIQIGINGMAGSEIQPLDVNRRMQVWYNFTHSGTRTNYKFDYIRERDNHVSWLDTVSPGTAVFYNDYFIMNGFYGRVMYISDYPKALESDIISEISKINCTSYVSVCNELLDLTGLKTEISRKHSSVGMQIENEKQRNRNNNDFLSDASDKLLDERKALVNYARAVDDGDDHYFNTTILIMFMAENMENLTKLTDKIKSTASIKSVTVDVCFHMQREALNTAFMFGVQEYKRVCNFSAPCLAMFMPYKTQELNDENGIYYGINQLSQNGIFGNRKLLQNYNGLILGKSGSGKSVFAKSDIISNCALYPEDQVIIIDPQNEYRPLASVVNGTVISFDSQKEVYVNPMDVDFTGVGYSDLQEIIADKTDFIFNLLSSCMRRDIDAEEQGVLGEVIEAVYSENYAWRKRINNSEQEINEYAVPDYMKSKQNNLPVYSDLSPQEQVREYSPTLQDVYQHLKDKNLSVANKLAAHMQIFVNGSLNLFNHRTNTDLNKKFIVFDLSSIKENLRVTSMLVMLEIIRDKTKVNFKNGFWTHLYIDEFHELLGIDSVAKFIIKLWKEIRKNHGVLTGITQNMTDLLNNSAQSENIAAILSNTEYFALLNQSTIDRDILMRFLPQISPAMFNYVEGAASGTGLLKMGSITVPFDFRMNKESRIYQIVNTDGVNS